MMKILFMCVANSARSQLAEGMARKIFGDQAEIQSAGSNPSTVNPYAVRALTEVGAECGDLFSKSVSELPPAFVESLDYVITLCAEEVCPVLLSNAKKLHWPLPDPAGLDGSEDEQLARFRNTRDEIEKRLTQFRAQLAL